MDFLRAATLGAALLAAGVSAYGLGQANDAPPVAGRFAPLAAGEVEATAPDPFAVSAGAGPIVTAAAAHGVSAAVRDLPTIGSAKRLFPKKKLRNAFKYIRPATPVASEFADSVGQRSLVDAEAVAVTAAGFEGIDSDGSGCGCAPPDTVGAAGKKQYVHMVNSAFAVFSKTGTLLAGPVDINSLFQSLPGTTTCKSNNDGDPIVVYDQLADRWLLSQFTASAPYSECIAISKTDDATGEYYVYAFSFGNTDFHDYPHFGLWPDAYYMATHIFANASSYAGGAVTAFERDKMLAGQPARMVQFKLANGNTSYGGHLPAMLDGTTLPPAGAPNYFVEVDRNAEIAGPGGSDAMRIFEFRVDWANPLASTFGAGAGRLANRTLPVAAFSRPPCVADPTFIVGAAGCVPQPGTPTQLDPLGDRLMYAARYRNFGTHESLVVNHSVVADGTTLQTGPRWYEVRGLSTTPVIHQQGTLAPAGGTDLLHRWMGSIAMDKFGNIGMGYSTSSNVDFPSIAYASRAPSDPLGILNGETQMIAGTASQAGIVRWGDYSNLTVDPANDCTFWYTTEYIEAPGEPFAWNTWIGSFKFPECEEVVVIDPLPPVLSVGGYENPDTDGAYALSWSRGAAAVGPDLLQESASCAATFTDDAEEPLVRGNNARWAGGNQWLSQPNPSTGSLSYYIPDGANQNQSLAMVDVLALPAGSGATLTFDTRQGLEAGFDFGFVDVSNDGGANYQTVATYTGDGLTPADAFVGSRAVDLSAFAGQSIKLRFRVTSDAFNIGQPAGWYIDNIAVTLDRYEDLATVAGTAYAVRGQPVGDYCYRVRTRYADGAGTVASAFSNVVRVTVAATNLPPVADAGADQVVDEGAAVALSGAGSNDPESGALQFAWTQVGGPGVALSGADTATASFTAPQVDGDTALTFELTVTDDAGLTAVDGVVVTVRSLAQEVTPFSFVERTGVATGVFVTSETITVSGFSGTLPVSVDNGGQVRIDNGAWTSAPGVIAPGSTLAVRHVSASAPDTAKVSSVTVGEYQTSFTSRTRAGDFTPDEFGFGTRTGQVAGAVVESVAVAPTGFDRPIAVVPGPGASYRVAGGGWIDDGSSATLQPGQTLQLRHAAASGKLEYRRTYVKAGGVTGQFTTRTQ